MRMVYCRIWGMCILGLWDWSIGISCDCYLKEFRIYKLYNFKFAGNPAKSYVFCWVYAMSIVYSNTYTVCTWILLWFGYNQSPQCYFIRLTQTQWAILAKLGKCTSLLQDLIIGPQPAEPRQNERILNRIYHILVTPIAIANSVNMHTSKWMCVLFKN